MKFRLPFLSFLVGAALLLAVQAPADEDRPPPPPTAPEGVEVQTRGQVHEAYAEAPEGRGEPSPVINKQPPDPVDEQPPDQKPEGDNVVWLPGYWSWNDDAKDFVWISGFWRNVPPDRTWVPGTWHQVEDGWQWVSGYWATDAQAEEPEYLPQPPDTIDKGPSTPAPGDNYNYVPGSWVYQVNRYLWRPGFWTQFRPGWMWTPASYTWTPAGYLFNEGFWDRPLCDRGLLFAPVTFAREVFARRGFVYRPSFVVQPDFLLGALFVNPVTKHYHFGDYFEERYRRHYVPWVDYRINRVTYDANYAYYRHTYASHPAWEKNLRTLYTARFAGEIPRPPRTLVQQTKIINNITVNKTSTTIVNKNVNITHLQAVSVVQPITRVKNVQVTGMARLAGIRPTAGKTAPVQHTVRLAKVTKQQLTVEKQHIERLRTVAQERRTTEVHQATKTPIHKLTAPAKAHYTLPKTAPPRRTITHPVKPPAPPVHPKNEVRTHTAVKPHPVVRPVAPRPVPRPPVKTAPPPAPPKKTAPPPKAPPPKAPPPKTPPPKKEPPPKKDKP